MSNPLRIVRTSVAVVGGLLLLPAVPLLPLGAYGVFLMITPEPSLLPGVGVVPHDLGQAFA